MDIRNLTITSAGLRKTADATVPYCYVKGTIPPAIRYHLQMPLPDAWNNRFVQQGDGGKDGDLDFFDDRLAQGYVVANSNTGHDSGAEPRASFNNRQAEIDFGYRAVHLLANAAKTVIRAYYGRNASYAYFEGCSSGGRQALTEAQRFPQDFDGIVAGAPVNQYQAINATHAWMVKKLFANNLAFNTDGDGVPDSLTKLQLLARTVMDKCDAGRHYRRGHR
jgi:feruloyl esterase